MNTLPDCVQTGCGGNIRITKQAREHLEAHPEVAGLIQEAGSMITLPTDGTFLGVALDFGRVIGQTACVEVADGDACLFAIRKGREVPTHVTTRHEKPDTNFFVVLAFKGTEGDWCLITAYTGQRAPREPHDRYFEGKRDGNEFAEALQFWTTHALVYEDEIMSEPFESSWEQILARQAVQV